MEQSAISLTVGYELRAIEATTENISVRELVGHGALSLSV